MSSQLSGGADGPVGTVLAPPGRPMHDRTRRLALLVSIGLVLAATLPPTGGSAADELPSLCLLCGPTGAADLALNAALFVPLGAAAAGLWSAGGAGRPGTRRRGVLAALAAGALLSGAVELVQAGVPGRHTALADLAANTAGAGIGGVLAASARVWLRPRAGAAGGLALAWGAIAAGVVLGTALLLAPSLPSSEYWVQRAPVLGHLERFPGDVLEAGADGLPLPPGRMEARDRRALVDALLDGPRLEATVRVGGATAGLAPVLSVFDDRQREIFVLGQDGRDLVFRLRRRADAAGFRAPELRARGLMEAVRPGEVGTLRVRPDGSGRGARSGQGARSGRGADRAGGAAALCLEADGERRCGLGVRAGRGWVLLTGPTPSSALPGRVAERPGGGAARGGAGAAARTLDALWIALLFLPLGFWARPTWGWRAGLALAGGALVAAPAAGPLLGAGAAEAAGLAGGLCAGAGLQGLVGRDGRRPGRRTEPAAASRQPSDASPASSSSSSSSSSSP